MDQRLRALNRFGLGARVGERGRLSDPRGWLRAQLSGGAPTLAVPPGCSGDEIADALRGFRMAQQSQDADRRDARIKLVSIASAETRAALGNRVTTDRPFVERLVAFWSNHLCISATAKVNVGPLAGSYEREVIRAHALGRFEDMVLASAKHPAMLFYLDNFQSIGPNSEGAALQRRRPAGGAQRGLNENYARELLELHTLGVNGGYSQQDVTELARLLTGWTISGTGAPGDAVPNRRQRRSQVREVDGPFNFAFQPARHEPGTKTVVGARYGDGVGEGEKAIRALCRHRSTATFVATKLVTHFVGDEPPAAAVERVAKTFRDSDGNLRKVAEVLIDLPEAWAPETKKFRTPQDWLVAVLRAFDQREVVDPMLGSLRQLRHQLWAPASPKGFGDVTREWADPDSLLNRAELARSLARRATMNQVTNTPRALLDVIDLAAGDPAIARLGDDAIDARERVALAIAGPAFQWR
jgi:uncharacterized protein (DUF1800 family)